MRNVCQDNYLLLNIYNLMNLIGKINIVDIAFIIMVVLFQPLAKIIGLNKQVRY